jgi:hypothetical protein
MARCSAIRVSACGPWGPNDGRHVVELREARYGQDGNEHDVLARAQSGLPFTTLVQGDVNGDDAPPIKARTNVSCVSALRALRDDTNPETMVRWFPS